MLIIARDSTYADSLRAYTVRLDGKKIGAIRDGELLSFDITPGRHTLVLRIDWASSRKFSFDSVEGQDTIFQCYSSVSGQNMFTKGLSVSYNATVGWNRYITLERVDKVDPGILGRIAFRQSNPIAEARDLAVTKLFYVSLYIACFVFLLRLATTSPYNFLTHTCVPNQSQQTLQLIETMNRPDLIATNEDRKYCSQDMHPEITRHWMLVSEAELGILLAMCAPITLSAGAIKVYRLIKNYPS